MIFTHHLPLEWCRRRGTSTIFLPKLAADFIIEIAVFRAGKGVESLGQPLSHPALPAIGTGAWFCKKTRWGLVKSHFCVGCEGWNGVSCPGREGFGSRRGRFGSRDGSRAILSLCSWCWSMYLRLWDLGPSLPKERGNSLQRDTDVGGRERGINVLGQSSSLPSEL